MRRLGIVQNVAVAITVFSMGCVMMTWDDRGGPRWLAVRAVMSVAALFARYLAAPKFGPEGSNQSLLLMAACLWLPLVVLSFVLGLRCVPALVNAKPAR
jgi:hypothetical protein